MTDTDDFRPYLTRLRDALAGAEAGDDAAALACLGLAGLGDGLPIIRPTDTRVAAMLQGRNPAAPAGVGLLPISFNQPNFGELAAAAVLAGCSVGALPLIAAALDATADPAFNLLGVQTTTGAAAPLVIVHGPAVATFGLNPGANALGSGFRANLTIGRAVRLVLADVGLCRPGEGDMATHGHPGKISWLVAENQPVSPWEPLSTLLGAEPCAGGVTVFAGVGNVEVVLPTTTAKALIARLAQVLAGLAAPAGVLLLPPESAQFLHRHGVGRHDLAGELEASGVGSPLTVVTGGTGIKATVIPGWGGPTEPVTRWLQDWLDE